MEIKDRIRNIREDQDLSQKEIAEALKIDIKTYNRYETGKHDIKISVMKNLAKYYNLSIDYLSGLIDETRPLYETSRKRNENLMMLSNEEIKIITAIRDNANFKNAVLANLKLITEPSDSKRETKKSV